MVIGFKGEVGKLKNLYKELGLKEEKPGSFDELEELIKQNNGDIVISNYNDLMVFTNPTADLVEKRNEVLKAVAKCKKNLYIGLTTNDPSLDKLKLDIAVCTNINTKDMDNIQSIFMFCNTDLPYSGKMADDKYAVKLHGDLRAKEMSITELKKLLKNNK